RNTQQHSLTHYQQVQQVAIVRAGHKATNHQVSQIMKMLFIQQLTRAL
ncbi:MAG: hypothetical protein ACI92E_000180, partial [Oceanicoccus sp.]